LSISTVSGYLKSREKYSTSTKSGIITVLKDFFRLPEVADELQGDFSLSLVATGNGRYESFPSTYTKEEVHKVLSCIDRTAADGKKDFVIILLAADTGLRFSDIINIKLRDIDWVAESINVLQVKTGEHVSVAINEALKWALLDYLKHARPNNVQYDNLFIRSLAPFIPYKTAGRYYKRLNRYFDKAGVITKGKHRGIHTMRHSLATRLMNDETPITIIADALGHKYSNVTNGYIRIDIDKLRLAVLEVVSDD
jgi:integrase